jgi:hypothetical protein
MLLRCNIPGVTSGVTFFEGCQENDFDGETWGHLFWSLAGRNHPRIFRIVGFYPILT